MKYSLWIVPDKNSEVYSKLNAIIKSLSQEFEAPSFVPHITLVSEINCPEYEIKELTAKLVDYSKPFKVSLDCMDYTDNLYQTLVVRAVFSEQLREINKTARTIFDRHSEPLYVPHLSILYKKGISQKQKKELVLRYENSLKGLSWEVEGIHIYTAAFKIKNWKFVDRMVFFQR